MNFGAKPGDSEDSEEWYAGVQLTRKELDMTC